MKVIRDAIHGNIEISEEEIGIIDSIEVQRLRRIRQLGMAYLVYPGANHTRFEHSLGVMHLAGRVSESLGLGEDEKKLLRISGLLHDIGHMPLSHALEDLVRDYYGVTHTSLSEKIIKEMDLGNFSNREVISIVRGEGELGKIISSPLDVDRADYLVRDSHYTGVAYGVIDLERLIQSFEISNGKVVLSEKGIKAAETLLFARFAMYPTVYLHHVSRIADAMLTRAVLSCFLDRTLSIEELSKMDDFDLISFLRRQEGIPSKIMRMIDERNLYKRVVYLSRMDMDDDFFELLTNLRSNGIKKIVEIENELASEFNLRNGDLLIDVFPSPSFEEAEVLVKYRGEMKALEEVSFLAKVLSWASWDYWRFGIYVPKEIRKNLSEETVLRKLRSILGG